MEQGPNKDIGEPVSKRWNHLYTGQFLWKKHSRKPFQMFFLKIKVRTIRIIMFSRYQSEI